MVNYNEIFRRPFSDIRGFIIGIILSMIPIANFIAIGYILENTKSAAKKNYSLTEWGNWGDLFVKGLTYLAISLIYAIPVLVIMAFGMLSAFSSMQNLTHPLQLLALLPTVGAVVILFLIAAVITSYFVPAAVLNYALTGKFGAAFDFAKIKAKTLKADYFSAWLLGTAYMVILVLVLMMIPIVGTGLAAYIGMLTLYTLLAETWGK